MDVTRGIFETGSTTCRLISHKQSSHHCNQATTGVHHDNHDPLKSRTRLPVRDSVDDWIKLRINRNNGLARLFTTCYVFFVSLALLAQPSLGQNTSPSPTQQVSVLEGGEAVLRCELQGTPQSVTAWSIGERVLYINSDNWNPGSNKYSVRQRDFVYDLIVKNVAQEDDSSYHCSLKDITKIHYVYLSVLVTPERPDIVLNLNQPVEGDVVELTCASFRGNPAPELEWYRGTEKITDPTKYIPAATKFGETISVLNRTITRLDHNAEYSCRATNVVNPETPSIGTLNMQVLYAPQIQFNKQSPYKVILGDLRIEIECIVDSNPRPDRTWWESADGTIQFGEQSKLTFEEVNKDHTGDYICKSSNYIGDRSQHIRLEVLYDPIVTIFVNNQPINDDSAMMVKNEGDNVELRCMVDSNPPPTSIRWVHQGANISTNAILEYRPIGRAQTGNYMCAAKNIMSPTDPGDLSGRDSTRTGQKSLQLLVQYRPNEARIYGPRQAVKGEATTLRCSVSDRGEPPAELYWSRSSDLSNVIRQGSELSLDPVKLDDDGEYVCQPTNEVGDGPPGHYSLIVNERPEWMSVNGRQGLHAERTFNISDSGVNLACRSRGRPAPTVTWLKDGETIESHDNKFYEIVNTQSTIDTISFDVTSMLYMRGSGRQGGTGLRIEDTGQYTCHISSDIAQQPLQSHSTVVIQYPPVLNVTSKKMAITINESVDMECLAHSLPRAEFEWYKDQVRLVGNNHMQITTEGLNSEGVPPRTASNRREGLTHVSRLRISKAASSDLGRYTCLGKNILGSNRLSIDLMVKTVPDPPTGLSIVSSTWESVEIQWRHGFNGGYEQFFVVHYASQSHGNGRHNVISKGATTFNVTDLFPSANYTFHIFGVNELGAGTPSVSLSAKTKGFLIEPPTDVYYEEESSLLTFRSPSTNYCVHIEIYRREEWFLHKGCENALGSSVNINQGEVEAVRVKLCLKRRQQICSPSENAIIVEPPAEDLSVDTIIIVACVCGFIVILLTVILIVLCCKRYRNTQKEQEANPDRDTNRVFTTNTSGSVTENGGPNSPAKPVKGIDNPALDYTAIALTEQTHLYGSSNNQPDNNEYIQHDSINPTDITTNSTDGPYGTYSIKNGNGYPGGYSGSNGHLPQDPPPQYKEVQQMDRAPSRMSNRMDNNKVNNNNRTMSNALDIHPNTIENPYDSTQKLNQNPYIPQNEDDSVGVTIPDPSAAVRPKKIIYEVIV